MKLNISKYVGTKRFYASALAVALPIMLQMAVTNFVNLLDNIMVGTLGTEAISAVSIVNQFIFVYNLIVFGAVSGAGIFTAQFHGKGDRENVRHTFRFKLMVNMAVGALSVLVFCLFSNVMIDMFLHDAGEGADLELAREEAHKYLLLILPGLIPHAIGQAYASTMRETERTVVPMVASIASVITNFVFNLVLIFGLLGFPELGVAGAAIATSISRFVELLILLAVAHKGKTYYFTKGVFRSFKVPMDLVRRIMVKGMPIIINEFMWALALTLRNQSYSTRGLEALAASSVSQTIFNLFTVVYLSMGSAIAVLVGNRLGSGDIDGAKDTSTKMITFAVFLASSIGLVVIGVAPYLTLMFDVEEEVRSLAAFMIRTNCILMPVYAFCNTSYYSIRSGGKVIVTILMDSGFMWACVVPVSLILANFTGVNIMVLYPICQSLDILKVVAAAILLKKYNWARRIA